MGTSHGFSGARQRSCQTHPPSLAHRRAGGGRADRWTTRACATQERGLHWDITLGSGWSTGGVGIDDHGARQLIAAELTLEGPTSYGGALRLVSVLGAEVSNEPENPPATLGEVVELTDQVQGGTLSWDVPAGTHRVIERLRIEDAFTNVHRLDPETGQPVAAELEGDVVTVALPGARGTVLWVNRPAPVR